MNLSPSPAVNEVLRTLRLFIQEAVIPAEEAYEAELNQNRWIVPQVMKDLGSYAIVTLVHI